LFGGITEAQRPIEAKGREQRRDSWGGCSRADVQMAVRWVGDVALYAKAVELQEFSKLKRNPFGDSSFTNFPDSCVGLTSLYRDK